MRRSPRRRRTVSAYRQEDKVVVMIPARFSAAEEAEWVEKMLARLQRSEQRGRRTDAELIRRAGVLSRDYLDGRAQPTSVRWVSNMTSRWGSCTVGDRTIRLSHQLQGMPSWVVDYVLLHELAHLLEAGHDARFWAWVDAYPRAERAKGFLEGAARAASLDLRGSADCD